MPISPPPCNGVMEGHLRTSKYVGFLALGFGITLIMASAVLPVSPASERFGPFRVNVRGDSCGPAVVVAFDRAENSECRTAAQHRLLATTAVGLMVVALGMALYAGGDERSGSRIKVPTTRVKRHAFRYPGGRNYRHG